MKNLIKALFLFSIFSIVSCHSSSYSEQDEDDEMLGEYEVVDTSPSMYAVSLKEAQANIKTYDSLSKVALGVDPIKAFTIRSIDFAEAIGLPTKYLKKQKYSHLRIYMGLDAADSMKFKIYLTPVEGARMSQGKPGKDVILDGPYTGKNGELGDSDGPYVLDFSQPCPNACDDGSPLDE